MDPQIHALLNDSVSAEEYERRLRELSDTQWKEFRRLAGRPTNPILEEQSRRDHEAATIKPNTPFQLHNNMTPDEFDKLKKDLAKEFLLIPKDRVYHLIGGAITVVLVGFGVSVASLFSFLQSQPAEIARKRIEAIRDLAEKEMKRIESTDSYVRYGSAIYIAAGDSPNISALTNREPNPILPLDKANYRQKWTIIPHGR